MKLFLVEFVLIFLTLFWTTKNCVSAQDAMNSYIIHTTIKPSPLRISQKEWYHSLVKEAMVKAKSAERNHEDQIFYTYDTVMMGFAATLTPAEAQHLSEMPGIISVQDEAVDFQLHTTRSPDFLGLNAFNNGFYNFEGDDKVIVGMIDSGIWPESLSFDDTGFSDIPSNWKGECVSSYHFNASKLCNRKLIGARYFLSGATARLRQLSGNVANNLSPRDKTGHGTHTSSTAVGSPVANASLFGFAKGTARGMAPKARLSIYKACWVYSDGEEICSPTDVLSAMEAAVKDGVHILSMSLGSNEPPLDFIGNKIAFGAFGAVKNGVFVACSAGNDGPSKGTVENTAPWIMTVGAGSIDRTFPASC